MNCTRPHVLISAASSGIGRASALHLADSADRSGSLRPSPAAMLSLVPCTFSRTSWPRALYRVLETTARPPPSKVSTAEAVCMSPSSPNHLASWFACLAAGNLARRSHAGQVPIAAPAGDSAGSPQGTRPA